MKVQVLKRRPRWVCALVGHRWETVGRQVVGPNGAEIVYAYHICWRCMSEERQVDG